MRHRKGIILAIAMALVCMAEGRAQGASQTVGLVIEATYAADSFNGERGLIHGKFPLQRSIHPFRLVAARLMKYAGLRLRRGDGGDLDADSTLHIEAQGLALGSLYDYMENRMRLRHLRFTGAVIEGRVSLTSRAAELTCAARFAGTIAASRSGLVVGAWDYREAPHRAPFDKALAQPGSFVAALAAIIGAIYGPAPLVAASDDPDDAIARHARKALDRLLGDAPAEEPAPLVVCVTP